MDDGSNSLVLVIFILGMLMCCALILTIGGFGILNIRKTPTTTTTANQSPTANQLPTANQSRPSSTVTAKRTVIPVSLPASLPASSTLNSQPLSTQQNFDLLGGSTVSTESTDRTTGTTDRTTELPQIASVPINCQISPWSEYGSCSATECGVPGTQTRTRSVVVPASNGGSECPTDLSESISCSFRCPPIDCQVSEWTPLTECSATQCGTTGSQTRTRTVTVPAAYGGRVCPPLSEIKACSYPCEKPVDCVASDWSEFGKCSAEQCGTVGTKTRRRTVITPASNGGAMCTDMEDNQPCSTLCPPPVNCVVSDWSPLSECQADTCNRIGRLTRTRTVVTPASGGGTECPELIEQQQCYKACPTVEAPPPPPPVDCVVTDWTPFSACSSTKCSIQGKQMRSRKIVSQPLNGGKECPNLEEYQVCLNPCPVETAPATTTTTVAPTVPVGLGAGKCIADNALRILKSGNGTITDLGLCNSMAKAAGAPQFGLENSIAPGTGQCFYGTLPARHATSANCTTYNGNLYGGEWSIAVYDTI